MEKGILKDAEKLSLLDLNAMKLDAKHTLLTPKKLEELAGNN